MPFEVSTFPEVPGETVDTAPVPLPTTTALAVSDDAPVPPDATPRGVVSDDTLPPVMAALLIEPLLMVGLLSVGDARVGDVLRTTDPAPVEDVTPVPPEVTPRVPPRVRVPAPTIGPPVSVRPVDPPLPLTLVTDPPPL